jgi:hypothetical protein
MTSNDLTPDLTELMDDKLSEEQLKIVITSIFNSNKNREAIALKSDRGVQNHFAKSYQSRFFLELLQNSRDAIKAGKIEKGKIKAWIESDTFCFANNGAEFNENGIKSICYPAISTKGEKGMIGHKGIGFNSVLEITDQPMIVTGYGTIYFSNKDAAALINDVSKPADILPLFQLPLFGDQTLSEVYPKLHDEGFTTVFMFPLDKRTDEESVISQAREITAEDVIFLGDIQELSIAGEVKKILATTPLIHFQDIDGPRIFKQYDYPFNFSKETVSKFLEDEAEQFQTDPSVECKFLLEVDESENFIPAGNAKLYLYYALEADTGLSFGIHSFFSVGLDRKSLTGKSPLNDELFKTLADYYGNDFLSQIKKDYPGSVLDILAYTRKNNAGLNAFYDLLKFNLKGKGFIYHPSAGRYVTPEEILLVTKEEADLFKNGKLGDKFLLTASVNLTEWLKKEAGVGVLHNEFILAHIEMKCQESVGDPSFFQGLYNINTTWKIDLANSKILLTENSTLKAGNDTEVFYLSRKEYSTPAILEKSLAFLKTGLKADDFNDQQRKLLGLTEYSVERLLSAALRLYNNEVRNETPEQDLTGLEIIRFLKRLAADDKGRIRDDISFPVIHKATGQRSWKNLLKTPVYYQDFEFSAAYLDDIYYVDLNLLNADSDKAGWELFLTNMGVWTIPGAFLIPGRKTLANGYLDNDRKFHEPNAGITRRFSQTVINNWTRYRDFILAQEPLNKALRISGSSDETSRLKHSDIIKYLKSSAWLPVLVKEEPALRAPVEIIGISSDDFHRVQNQVILEFFDVFIHDHIYQHQFLMDLEICHFSLLTQDNYKTILKLIREKYGDLAIEPQKRGDFEKFFNRILSYLHDYLQSKPKENTDYLAFKEVDFVSKSFNDSSLHWSSGKETIHIDNKAFLDRMITYGITSHIRNPFAFTKRDRGEWGKYALRIGRPLTKIINTIIVSEGRTASLTEIADQLEIIIAFVEDDQLQHFSDEIIESFKNDNVRIHDHLDIKADVEGVKLDLRHEFFVEGEGEKTILHLDRNVLNRDHKSLASALAGFFEQFTKNEMKRLDLMIEDSLYIYDRAGKYAYAVKRNIDQNRLDDIAEVLTKGSSIPPKPVVKSTPAGRVVSGAPAVLTTVIKVKTEKEVVELTVTGGHEAFLERLKGAVGGLVSGFTGGVITPVFGHNHAPRSVENSGRVFYSTPEYSDSSLKDIGFYGEFYIYHKIMERDEALLSHLGLRNAGLFELEWFNYHRILNKDLPDRSMGMGCDMQIADKQLYIEVKTMRSESDLFHISEKEFKRMKDAGNQYFLVIVKHIYEPENISTQVIRNPYQQFVAGSLSFIEAKINSPI